MIRQSGLVTSVLFANWSKQIWPKKSLHQACIAGKLSALKYPLHRPSEIPGGDGPRDGQLVKQSQISEILPLASFQANHPLTFACILATVTI